ncbi:RpiB/LacA/LacB family sugar-phosphate isomerase [Pedobacter sp. UYP24]
MPTEQKIKIAIGANYPGFEYKKMLKTFLLNKYEVRNFGSYTTDSVDYPNFAHPLSSIVESKEHDFGILVCGSANGVAITANKPLRIRAAIVCWTNSC